MAVLGGARRRGSRRHRRRLPRRPLLRRRLSVVARSSARSSIRIWLPAAASASALVEEVSRPDELYFHLIEGVGGELCAPRARHPRPP